MQAVTFHLRSAVHILLFFLVQVLSLGVFSCLCMVFISESFLLDHRNAVSAALALSSFFFVSFCYLLCIYLRCRKSHRLALARAEGIPAVRRRIRALEQQENTFDAAKTPSLQEASTESKHDIAVSLEFLKQLRELYLYIIEYNYAASEYNAVRMGVPFRWLFSKKRYAALPYWESALSEEEEAEL